MARHCPFCAHRSTTRRPILAVLRSDTTAAVAECRCPACGGIWKECAVTLGTAETTVYKERKNHE